MAIKDKASSSVSFDGNFQGGDNKEDATGVDKKYSLDSDEEDNFVKSKKLNIDDIDGQEKTTKREEDGQRITPFNLDDENEEGYFDENGTFIFVNSDKDEIRDNWLDSIGDYKVPDVMPEQKDKDETPDPYDKFSITEIMEQILTFLQPSESVAKALKRLGGTQLSASQRLKLKKQGKLPVASSADKEKLDKLTSLSDYLLHKGRDSIYQDSYEKLKHEIKAASDDIFGDDNDDEKPKSKRVKFEIPETLETPEVKWFYKLGDQLHGPHSSKDMLAMHNNGHFKDETVVCKESYKDTFYSIKRINFDDYID